MKYFVQIGNAIFDVNTINRVEPAQNGQKCIVIQDDGRLLTVDATVEQAMKVLKDAMYMNSI